MNTCKSFFFCVALTIAAIFVAAQQPTTADRMIDVGVATVDITPVEPVRLTGYGARSKEETLVVMQKLYAKAIAFGRDEQQPSLLITVDLLGITEQITTRLRKHLSQQFGIDPANVVICASHTHGGPELGNTINILQYREGRLNDSMVALDQLIHIARYTQMLEKKLQEVSAAALNNRKPGLVAWGQGQASFAANRRTKGGPIDPSLPLMRVNNPDGSLRAVLVNYACHGTTLEGVNEIHGDWIGEAQRVIEERHPGATALVAIGCGADADPKPRGQLSHMQQHGKEIADNVDKLLDGQLEEITVPPVGRMTWVKLPFAKVPTVDELIKTTEDKSLRGHYARVALESVQRGDSILSEVNYPVQVWSFGDKLAMINLAGEVVVDYALRLKHELGAEQLWVNGYANDVPSYIASRRVIREGGYEADFSMTCYHKPGPYAEEIEDIIVSAVHEIIPASFRKRRDTVNSLRTVEPEKNGTLQLTAAMAKTEGPNIKYMPEWKAFGWFNTDDLAEWNVQVPRAGKYEVHLKWSVSDDDAGKAFLFEAGNKKIRGKVGKTGSWFTYFTHKIGTVQLRAGEQKMVFKSGAPHEKGPMLDLANISLIPVK